MATRRRDVSELKLRRTLESNNRLQEDLARPIIRVSEAARSLINHCRNTPDHLVPSVWGPVAKKEDPYSQPPAGSGCCVVQ